MDIRSETKDDCLILSVRESRIDAAGAMEFKDRIRQLVRGHGGRVMIDLARVEFLDSSGLGALVAAMKMLDGGRKLELANCGAPVLRVLTLTRMDRVFVLHQTDTGLHRTDTAPTGRDAA